MLKCQEGHLKKLTNGESCYMCLLFSACENNGTVFGTHYHPGAYDLSSKRYTCCDKIKNGAEPCTELTFQCKPQNAAVNGK